MIKPYEGINPPTSFYQSTRQWYHQVGFQQKVASYKEFNVDQPTDYFDPKRLEESIHWKFLREKNRQPPPTFMATIPGGRVWGPNGAVISPDNNLLWDISIHYDFTGKPIPESHPVFYMPILPPFKNRQETLAVLTFCAAQYYYHWLFDVLPRIHLLRSQNLHNHKMVFNFNGSLPFQGETLAALNVPRTQIIPCQQNFHLKAKKLIVPSLSGYNGHMPKWTCDFLRCEFLPKVNRKKISGYERIYISRRNARTRNVLNEDKVVALLRKFGFKEVKSEKLPVAEQIRIFLSAEAVVSAHGSGLANLVFCNPRTKVLEFFSPNFVNVLYWILSNHIGLDYYYLIGEGERPPKYVDPFIVWDNITIDLEKLENMLNMMGL